MRALIGLALLLTIVGCSPSSPKAASVAAPAPTPTQTATGAHCTSPAGPDVIVWQLQPGAPAYAQLLGSRTVTCQSVEDFMRQVTPTQAGNCVLIALASTNPGYDVDAEPAPKPRRVIARIGPSC